MVAFWESPASKFMELRQNEQWKIVIDGNAPRTALIRSDRRMSPAANRFLTVTMLIGFCEVTC